MQQDPQHLFVCDHNFEKGQSKGVDPVPLVEKGFVDIARLSAGMAFGNRALLDEGHTCEATMKTLTKTHLITLKNSDFIKYQNAMDHKRRMELINFIRKIDLFAKLTNVTLIKFSMHLKPKSCFKDFFLFKEGQPANAIFIIKSGEFLVTRKLVTTNTQSPLASDVQNIKKAKIMKNEFYTKNKVTRINTHSLGYIGKLNMCGEEDAFSNDYYRTSVQCISKTAEYIFIKKEDFERLRSNQNLWSKLTINNLEKVNKYLNSIKNQNK